MAKIFRNKELGSLFSLEPRASEQTLRCVLPPVFANERSCKSSLVRVIS